MNFDTPRAADRATHGCAGVCEARAKEHSARTGGHGQPAAVLTRRQRGSDDAVKQMDKCMRVASRSRREGDDSIRGGARADRTIEQQQATASGHSDGATARQRALCPRWRASEREVQPRKRERPPHLEDTRAQPRVQCSHGLVTLESSPLGRRKHIFRAAPQCRVDPCLDQQRGTTEMESSARRQEDVDGSNGRSQRRADFQRRVRHHSAGCQGRHGWRDGGRQRRRR
mmetsp:Transcript_68367/g.204881  ORF Transcript_68367/g.204881 Transcript_68367/m.204881 type:complete len:228 (-) Transcript_68367:1092-1775(-)